MYEVHVEVYSVDFQRADVGRFGLATCSESISGDATTSYELVVKEVKPIIECIRPWNPNQKFSVNRSTVTLATSERSYETG